MDSDRRLVQLTLERLVALSDICLGQLYETLQAGDRDEIDVILEDLYALRKEFFRRGLKPFKAIHG